MDYRKQVGYLKGLCSGLTLSDDKPEGKLLTAIVDTLEALADAVSDTRDEIEELEDDIQDISDEVGELESMSEDMDRLDDYLDELGEAINDLASMLKNPDEVQPIRLISRDGAYETDDDDDDDDEYDEDQEDITVYAVCPECGAHVSIEDDNIVIEKK